LKKKSTFLQKKRLSREGKSDAGLYNVKYNGKELQEELGLNMYDYGARNYDASIGRTTTYDPLAEKFYNISPQSFLNNNPLYFVDPTGMQSEGWIKQVIDGKTTMTYDPNVNTVDEANIANYKGVESVGPTGVTVSKGVTYNLNVDGSVTTNGAGIQAHEIGTNGPTFTTPGGTQISSTKMDYVFSPSNGQGAATSMEFSSPAFAWGWAAKGLGAIGNALFGSASKTAPASSALTNFYPKNNGFLGASHEAFLMPGQQISRYGLETGRFFSPAGTTLPMRALPAGTNTSLFNSYTIMKPFPVQSGTIAPAFGQPGLGIQYMSNVSAEVLLKRGIIK
jgi:RHS repeat-associated protein